MRTRGILLVRDAILTFGLYPSQRKLSMMWIRVEAPSQGNFSCEVERLARPLRQTHWSTSSTYQCAAAAS